MEERGKTFFFPPYRLQPDERRLSRNGEVVSLTPKEFDTLLVLVEAGGRVVGKEELIGRVWPDSYVGDGSLARNISVLRKALGEEVIETLPKKGYRINVSVSRVEAGHPPQTAEEIVRTPAESVEFGPTEPKNGVRWWRRGVLVGPAAACAVMLAMVVHLVGTNSAKGHSAVVSEAAVNSILIQKEGGLDPLDEGFKLAYPDGDYTHVIWNLDRTGFDRWRLVTRDQNRYYRSLSDAEQKFVSERDWKLTCVCAVEKGAGESDIDVGAGIGSRFDVLYFQEGNKYFVGLPKQISPEIVFDQKVEFAGVGDVDHPHTYELRYDHATQTASLWIDGKQRASDYHGYHQYQRRGAFSFGSFIYRTVMESSMVFRRVRFEAH